MRPSRPLVASFLCLLACQQPSARTETSFTSDSGVLVVRGTDDGEDYSWAYEVLIDAPPPGDYFILSTSAAPATVAALAPPVCPSGGSCAGGPVGYDARAEAQPQTESPPTPGLVTVTADAPATKIRLRVSEGGQYSSKDRFFTVVRRDPLTGRPVAGPLTFKVTAIVSGGGSCDADPPAPTLTVQATPAP